MFMGIWEIFPLILNIVSLLTVIRIFWLAKEVRTRIDVLDVELDAQELHNQELEAGYGDIRGNNDE